MLNTGYIAAVNLCWREVGQTPDNYSPGTLIRDGMTEEGVRDVIDVLLDSDISYSVIESRIPEFKLPGELDVWHQFQLSCVVDNNHIHGIWSIGRDISELKHAGKQLQAQRALFETYFNNSHDPTVLYGLHKPIDTSLPWQQQVDLLEQRLFFADVNPSFCAFLGFDDKAQLLEKKILDAVGFSREDQRTFLSGFVQSNYQASGLPLVSRTKQPTGEERHYRFSAQGNVVDGQLCSIIGSYDDCTESIRYTRKLRHQSLHDSLTGMPNRHYLFGYFNDELDDHRITANYALMLIDLDMFKDVNDNLGHYSGDLLLVQVGQRLSRFVQQQQAGGLAARLGGDEFCRGVQWRHRRGAGEAACRCVAGTDSSSLQAGDAGCEYRCQYRHCALPQPWLRV